MPKTRMLLLSFSTLTSDARILRQIELFKDRFSITTCGYGTAPDGVSAHLRIPDEIIYWKYPRIPLMLHQYRYAYFHSPAVKFAYPLLKRRDFDIVWANDFDTLPMALALGPSLGVHVDLHEHFLSADDRPLRFRLFVQPFRTWVLRKYLPQCESISSVTQAIARQYEELSHKPVQVVSNAAPYETLTPTPVDEPIRFVHVGATMPGRGLEEIVQAVADCDADVELDCYLVPGDQVLLEHLKEMASDSGGKVKILEPIPHDTLVRTINAYDASLIFIQPTHFSYKYCLPNKLFQSIQARLAIITGPSPEIVSVVNEYGIGTVTEDFTTESLKATLQRLTSEDIARWKNATIAAAEELHAENQNQGWLTSLDEWIPGQY